jgi:protein-disulfide isomerase
MSKSTDRATERAARTQALLDQQRKDERRRQLLITGAVAAVLAIVIGIGVWVQSGRDTTGETPDAVPAGATDDYGIVVGADDAPVTISIYEDLQCPICAQLEATVGEQLNDAIEAGDVRVEYRMVSFLDDASENDYSSRALNALLATHDTAGVDAFKTLHDDLYADQPAEGTAGPEDDALIAAAVAAGATESDVRPLVEDKVYEQWITNATDAMSQNDVNGTPTVLVDGEPTDGDPAQAVLDAIGG